MSEGWSWLISSRVAHYFVKGISLCGRWRSFMEPVGEGGHLHCQVCEKALAKEGKEAGLR